jgi:MSHA biogenesis protein MshQ
VAANYKGALARAVSLSAWSEQGGSVAASPGSLATGTVAASSFVAGVATVTTPVYNFPAALAFSHLQPRGVAWVTPATIYLRAIETANASISSLRSPASSSVEGAVRILSGRLYVANIHGSELLPVPVKVSAQYWSGSNWESSSTDGASTVNPVGGVVLENCLGNLSACNSVATTANLTLYPQEPKTLVAGSYTFHFRAAGAGRTGSADFRLNNPAWLPSTQGRVRLGVSRSPLIYLREVF